MYLRSNTHDPVAHRQTLVIECDGGVNLKVHITQTDPMEHTDFEIWLARVEFILRGLQLSRPSPRALFGGRGPDFPSYRPGQLEAAAIAIFEIFNRAKPLLLPRLVGGRRIYIDAPTGSGKSIIAQVVADWQKQHGDFVVPIATADHQLQEQYAETEGLLSVTGRANWPCLIEETTADKAPCATGKLLAAGCSAYKYCPYFLQKHQAVANMVFVSNYQYILRLRNSLPMPFLIGDEGHDAEKIIRDFKEVTFSLPWDQRLKYRLDCGRDVPKPHEAAEWISLLKSRLETLDIQYKKLFESLRGLREEDDLAAVELVGVQIRQIVEETLQLTKARALFEEKDYYLEPMGQKYTITPLVGDMQFFGDAVLLSATLANPEVVENAPVIIIELPSHFPVSQRPVIYSPAAKLNKGADEAAYQALARAVDAYVLKHNTEKGVVHTVSYDLAQKIKSLSKYPGLIITHGPGGRDKAVEEFRNAPPGRVLVSPAVATGVDLPYDLCRWQAIAKVPFPNFGDGFTKARASKYPELADLDTARTIVQMAGRGMRAEDDSCTTYILDQNFDWFYRQHRDLFPGWFRDAVIMDKTGSTRK